MADRATVKQCATCPWKVGADPYKIPGYSLELHRKLEGTIRSGLESIQPGRAMACHYSAPEEPRFCAGWLAHQAGPGNNLAVRMGIMTGKVPAPVVDGDQHETFEATLPDGEP